MNVVYHSHYDRLDAADWCGHSVFVFGAAEADPAIPGNMVFRVPKPAHVNPGRWCATLPPEAWAPEVDFVLPRDAAPREAEATRMIQMFLISAQYAIHFAPPEGQGVAPAFKSVMRGLTDPSRALSQAKNYPWLLRYPLADKLAALRLGKPALILLSGPSLTPFLPRLPAMARHCLVIATSRTLKSCLAANVRPDFVMQYDTYMEQRQFYDGIPDLPETVLVTLSSAHIHPYAEKFKGIFFRASFHPEILSNPFMLRDGVEGSLIACLGLAEVLYAPQVFIAGADLSWLPNRDRYFADGASATAPETSGDVRITVQGKSTLRLARRDGVDVFSTPWFIASVIKAAQCATAIHAAGGTRFFTLGDQSLLLPDLFPEAKGTDILALPKVDREGIRTSLGNALALREEIDLNALTEVVRNNERTLQLCRTVLALKQADPAQAKDMGEDPMVQSLRFMRGAYWKFQQPVESTMRLLKVWADAFEAAERFILAHRLVRKGRSLCLLCLASEQEAWEAKLERLIPGIVLEAWTAADPGRSTPKGRTFDDYSLPRLLLARDLSFVSPGVMNRFEYFWEVMPQDNIYDLRRLGPQV